MTECLKPYPAYKDSGVPWLEQVPKLWEVTRLRHAVDMRVSNIDKHATEGELPVRLCNYVDVYKNDWITSKLLFMRATAQPAEVERFRLQLNDVLITKDSETWTDIGVPALVKYAADDLVCGYHLAMLRPRQGRVRGPYLFRALQSRVLAYQFHVQANGVTRYGLSHGDIKSVVLPLPPTDEQDAIARFLDHADRRISRYVRAEQRLIALVREKRMVATSEALEVPGVRMLRMSVAADSVARLVDRQGQQVYTTIGLFNRGRGIFHKVPRKGAELGDSTFYWVRQGDLVLSGQFAWEGAIAVAALRDDGCVASHRYPILRGKPGMTESEFLFSFLQTQLGQLLLDTHSRGAAGRNRPLNLKSLLKEKVAVPPLWAQARVSALVRAEARLQSSLARLLSLIREARARLVTDVVTGRIDIREAAGHLSPEALDGRQDEAGDACAAGELEEPEDEAADPGEAEA